MWHLCRFTLFLNEIHIEGNFYSQPRLGLVEMATSAVSQCAYRTDNDLGFLRRVDDRQFKCRLVEVSAARNLFTHLCEGGLGVARGWNRRIDYPLDGGA
jgi:hypothetical protein